MDKSTVKKIVEINQEFYQTFAQPFAATRQRLQPGVRQVMKTISPHETVLDLGCGNGEIASSLFQEGFQGRYLGVDFSRNLLEFAASHHAKHYFAQSKQQAEDFIRDLPGSAIFLQVDLSAPNWDEMIPSLTYDTVFAFAALHHIPSEALRLQILSKINSLLKPGGFFWHSEWQFLNSLRLKARIQPWSRVNLSDSQVDPGDYLMDWRQGGVGFRYVHHFDVPELNRLANQSGFSVCETFFSDGEGSRLAIYQKWQTKHNQSAHLA